MTFEFPRVEILTLGRKNYYLGPWKRRCKGEEIPDTGVCSAPRQSGVVVAELPGRAEDWEWRASKLCILGDDNLKRESP